MFRIKSYFEFINEAEEAPMTDAEIQKLAKDPKILALASKIMKKNVDEIKKKIESPDSLTEEENLNESIGITLALALPMLLEAGGSLLDLIKRKFGLNEEQLKEYKKWSSEYNKTKEELKLHKKSPGGTSSPQGKQKQEELVQKLEKMKKERDEKFGTQVGEKLTEAGHKLHKIYTSPIRALLWTISRFLPSTSELRKKQIREKVSNIIYAILLIGYAGHGILHSLSHLSGVSEVASGIIEGSETGKNISTIASEIPLLVNVLKV